MQPSSTEAAMSDHRFERPLDPDSDMFIEPPIEDGDVDFENLKAQAMESGSMRAKEAKKRYQVPPICEGKAEHAKQLAKRILGLLIMSRYRRGPVQFVQESEESFLQKIVDAILNDRPIELILSFFGSKVQNPLKTWATNGTEVDISEMASLLRFYEITQAIKALYEPGAVVHVACDGSKYAEAIGFTQQQGHGYFQNIQAMCRALQIDDCVRTFDEADKYPSDHQDRVAEQLQHITGQYQAQEPTIVQTITKLRASMCLSMPVDTKSVTVVQLRMVYSGISDADLEKRDAKALALRRHISRESVNCCLKYIAVYDAVKQAGIIERAAPNALRATVHPKPGQIGLYAVNQHTNNIFPHHGQGIMHAEPRSPDLEKIRIGFRADVERRIDPPARGIRLPKYRQYAFASDEHPFLFTT